MRVKIACPKIPISTNLFVEKASAQQIILDKLFFRKTDKKVVWPSENVIPLPRTLLTASLLKHLPFYQYF